MDKQTSKTLGQKIYEARAQKNISQTELAEALDVSRQSISKWETDAALPEIDKLIALSRYFSVPVGALLGLEEDTASEPPDDGELSETQLKMVQEIVDRYLAAQPKPMSKKRRTILKIAVCAAAICLAVGLSKMTGQLKDLSRQYHDLQYSINNVTNGVNNQINSISGRVEELLKQQNNLTADYETEIEDIDIRGRMVTFTFRAVPKTFVAGMTAWLEAENGTAKFTFGPFEPVGQTFSGEATFALTDDISLYIVFETAGKRETQLLDTYIDLYRRTLPMVYLDDPLQAFNGKIVLDDEPVMVHITGYYGDDDVDCPEVMDCRVGLFINKRSVGYLTQQEGGQVNGRGYGIYLFAAAQREEIAVAEGDEVCFAAVIEDEFGRRFLQPGVRYTISVSENGYLLPTAKFGGEGMDFPVSDPVELAEWTF